VVLAVSLPSVVDEMTPEDEADFQRFEKLLDRLGKAMIMSAESEISEIIRRRLFEWGGLRDDAKKTAAEYADWVQAHRTQVPNWFPVDLLPRHRAPEMQSAAARGNGDLELEAN